MFRIPKYEKYGGEKNIAILDNSSVEFLLELKNRGIDSIQLIRGYDVVLVPHWVLNEVSHSEGRICLLEDMRNNGAPVYSIDETEYSALLGHKDLDLYRVVLAAASKLGELKSYLRKNVGRDDPADIEDSSEWMRQLYEDWPIGKRGIPEKEETRKNAGEVSITILAEIFTWYLRDIENITIYSQDRDTYDFEREATNIMQRAFRRCIPVTVTYKSNDAILLQLYRESTITAEQIREIRTNARMIRYTEIKGDKSVALIERLVDTEAFIRLVKNSDTQILF